MRPVLFCVNRVLHVCRSPRQGPRRRGFQAFVFSVFIPLFSTNYSTDWAADDPSEWTTIWNSKYATEWTANNSTNATTIGDSNYTTNWAADKPTNTTTNYIPKFSAYRSTNWIPFDTADHSTNYPTNWPTKRPAFIISNNAAIQAAIKQPNRATKLHPNNATDDSTVITTN